MAPPDAGRAPEDQTNLFWRFHLPYLIEQYDHGDTSGWEGSRIIAARTGERGFSNAVRLF